MENENLVEKIESKEIEAPGAEGEVPTETDGFKDGGESGAKSEGGGETGKPQSAEQNAKNAERRRTAEGAEAKAVRERAILDALDRKNPYTGDEMKDSEDVEEYLAMREIEKNGGDPLKDFSKFQKQKAREKRAALENEAARQERFQSDAAALRAEFPDVDLKVLLDDENFRAYAEGKLGTKGTSLATIYRGYESFVERVTGAKAERAKRAQAIANQKASVGSLASSHKEDSGYYTPEQVRGMSREEVKVHYDDIIKSMKKWK